MANSSNTPESEMSNICAGLQLDEEEEGGLIVAGEEIGDPGDIRLDSKFCLVGRLLMDKGGNFIAMKNTMASLWRPGRGVCIKNLSPTLFLFQFFHEIDVRRVLESCPWTFDQHILIIRRLGVDEQPQNIPLFHTYLWVQVYNLPLGFQSEKILQSIGNFTAIKNTQFFPIIIETDCLQVFNALIDSKDYQNGFSLIISDCRALAHCLKEVTFSFVRRSANTAAHVVAKVGCSLSGPGEWRHVPPPWLFSHLSV